MEDYISARRRVRQGIDDLMAADPSINTVAVSGLVVDRQGFEYFSQAKLSEFERSMMSWLGSEWAVDTVDAWNDLVNMLYGALQACLNHDQIEAYSVYSFLAEIARERRHQALLESFEEGA